MTVLEASGCMGGRIETHGVPGAQWYMGLGAMRTPYSHRYGWEKGGWVRKTGGMGSNLICTLRISVSGSDE